MCVYVCVYLCICVRMCIFGVIQYVIDFFLTQYKFQRFIQIVSMIFSFLLVSSITWHMYYLCKAKIILDCNLKANKQTNKYVFEPKGATAWETQIYLATLVMFHRDKVEATLYSTSCHPGSVRSVLWK